MFNFLKPTLIHNDLGLEPFRHWDAEAHQWVPSPLPKGLVWCIPDVVPCPYSATDRTEYAIVNIQDYLLMRDPKYKRHPPLVYRYCLQIHDRDDLYFERMSNDLAELEGLLKWLLEQQPISTENVAAVWPPAPKLKNRKRRV